MEEPRYLLDKDCVCYGCEFYKHVLECDIFMHLGDVDKNGGVCDTEKLCVAGNRNAYRKE